MRNEHLDLSVCLYTIGGNGKALQHLYDGISTFEEAHLLSLHAMNNKRDDELVVILPGWNVGLSEDELARVKELVEKYKED